MILVIDNYDSFTWNLVDLVKRSGAEVLVKRNDGISTDEISNLHPNGILISPGPGRPSDSGICPEVLKQFGSVIPILGICLGHQLIGENFGANVTWADEPMHGKTTMIHHDDKGLFAGIQNPFRAMRYHSLIIRDHLPNESLQLSAWTAQNEVMAVRHNSFNINGLQFHPESILTEHGETIIKNWVNSF